MRLRPRRRVLISSSPADLVGGHDAARVKRVAGTGRIRRLIRIGMLLTVIAVRPRWKPLLAAAVLVVIGVIERQGMAAACIIPAVLCLWTALMIEGDTDANREWRAQLRRELAAYSTPAQRFELVAALDRYPDGVTHEIREILAGPPIPR